MPIDMERRTVLTAISSLPILSAGCLSNNSNSFGLSKLLISNLSERQGEVVVEVKKEEEVVYEESHVVDAGEEVEIVEDWMGDQDEYIINSSMTNDDSLQHSTTELSNQFTDLGDQNCFKLNIAIDYDYSLTSFVSPGNC